MTKAEQSLLRQPSGQLQLSIFASPDFNPHSPRERHVIISCSATKLKRASPAHGLYTGVVWRAWRAYLPGTLPRNWYLWALSAQHGLVPSGHIIEPYNRQLSLRLFPSLKKAIRSSWANRQRLQGIYMPAENPECVVLGGALYQKLAKQADLPIVATIDGRDSIPRGGIGILGQRTRIWAHRIRTEMDIHPGTADVAWNDLKLSSIGETS